MTESTVADRTAIVGIGASPFSKESGRTELSLAAEAVHGALDDAGLTPSDVDGMVTFTLDFNDEIEIARVLGAGELRFFSRIPHGGGAACGTVAHAAMAVATGMAEVVVCYRSLNGRSWRRYGAGGLTQRQVVPTADMVQYSWYLPFGLITPASWVAMFSQRYMHDFGVTGEDLGRVTVSARGYAATNPAAHFFERPLTLEEHQASRWVVEPLRVLDCCQESDGAVALVVTSAERARDLRQPPAMIRAAAQGSGDGQHSMTSFYRDDITRLVECEVVARQLWSTGLSPADIQAANVYDPFTPFVLIQLEEFGFCERGEAAAFVADGNLDPGGRLPTNTNGGQLGEAYIHGMNGIAEGVRLVRGTSVNQPAGVENVLVTAGVGVPTSGLVLGSA
ncbi:MAG TPA: lipid-transfer protein [Actinomycetota bacterium]|nr:lipid-transfer protein [Actinomycetota bacterium]